jgi:RHS repeat-associated protein
LGRLEKSNGTLYWRSYAGQVIEETNTSGTMTRDYIFFAGRRIAWRDSSGNVYYYFVDAIGSTRAVTNATGTTCFNADYYPYGQENDYNTSCSPTYKFTGYEFDSETGNYYAYARYYSPRLGRFLSADLLGGNISSPQSLNRYAYALNNPETFIDPLGLCPDGQQPVVGANGKPGCVGNPESVVDTVNGGPPPMAPFDYYRFLGEAGPNGCGPYGCPKPPPPDSILYAILKHIGLAGLIPKNVRLRPSFERGYKPKSKPPWSEDPPYSPEYVKRPPLETQSELQKSLQRIFKLFGAYINGHGGLLDILPFAVIPSENRAKCLWDPGACGPTSTGPI